MASDFEQVCDWLLADLQAEVPSLIGTVPHLYAPWDPERFVNDGQRHVAVWPRSDLETAAALTTAAHELVQSYVVAYWEPAGFEDERQVADEGAAADLLRTHNAIRDRLYRWSNQIIGEAFKVWYAGAAINDATSHTRWIVVAVEVHRAKEFV